MKHRILLLFFSRHVLIVKEEIANILCCKVYPVSLVILQNGEKVEQQLNEFNKTSISIKFYC